MEYTPCYREKWGLFPTACNSILIFKVFGLKARASAGEKIMYDVKWIYEHEFHPWRDRIERE